MKPKEGNTLFFEYGYNDIPFCLHISNEETYPVSGLQISLVSL